jgi:hypothetical protein
MVSARVFFTIAGALGLLGAAAACNSVLGISSAALDPTFGLEAGAGGDAGGPLTPCQSYCNAVVKNCKDDAGAAEEYNDVPTCLALCGAFDPGQPTDTNQDSLGCRAHYAALAATDPTKCRAAGPLGGGVCGQDLCATFCALDTFACTGPNAEYDGGEVGCGAACQADFDTYVEDAGVNDLTLSTGNTLNCRIWHLEAAVGGGAGELQTHCPHTAIVSAFCHN